MAASSPKSGSPSGYVYLDYADEMGASVGGPGYVLTFVNTIKSAFGLGILTMPFAFNEGGWLAATIAFAIAALASGYCATLLLTVLRCLVDGREEELVDCGDDTGMDEPSSTPLRSRDAAAAQSGELPSASRALPPSAPPRSLRIVAAAITEGHMPFQVLVDSLLFIAMAGASIGYVSFLSGSVGKMIRAWGGVEVSRKILAAVFALLYTPVAFTKQLAGALTVVSFLGIFFLVFGAVVFVSHEGGDCAAASASTTNSTFNATPAFRPSGIAETIGVAAFSNEGLMALVIPIFAEAHVTKRRGHTYTALVLSVVALCVLMNCTIGLVGSFCERELKPLITSVLPLTDALTATAVVLLNLHIVCTFPQVTFVALVIARKWLDVALGTDLPEAAAAAGAAMPADAFDSGREGERQHLLRNTDTFPDSSLQSMSTLSRQSAILSVVIVWLICITGGMITNVGGIVALTGGIANTGVTYIVPLVLFEFRRIASVRATSAARSAASPGRGQRRWYARLPRRTWVHLVGIVVATCLGIWASTTALISLVSA